MAAPRGLSLFLRLFLPTAALVLLGGWLYSRAEQEQVQAHLMSHEAVNVGRGGSTLAWHAQTIVDDLHYLANHDALRALLDHPGPAERKRLETDFATLMAAKPVYDQIRWLDAEGREVVRVDLRNGGPQAVPAEKLQYKGDRYYFLETLRLAPGEVYLSPLDLNIENGRIEVPYKPMLRVATPVADASGRKRGVVVLNYLGDALIRRLEAAAEGIGDHLLLVDRQGFFLHAPDPADEWGFMFQDDQRSLARRYPAAWARMQDGRGQFKDAGGLWTYERIQPLPGRDYHWLVVAHVRPAQLASLSRATSSEEIAFIAFLLLVLGIGAWRLGLVMTRETAARERFQAVFDHAMVGMASTSPDKGWLSVNAALCDILGYPEAELKQKTWTELTHPDDLDTDLAQFEQVLAGQIDGYRMEKRFIRKDGQVIHALIAAQAIRKPDGQVDFFSAVVEDITERRQAEAQLTFQAARAAALLELPHLAEQLDEPAFMQAALDRAEQLTGSRIGFIHFVNEDGESIELVTWSHNTLEHYCQAAYDRHYPISQAGIWADAAREKAPVVINDYAASGHKHGLPPGHSPLARLISVPIVEGEQVRMMIGVGNKAGDYHAVDVETALLIGNTTWRLVQRRRILDALRLAMQVVNASPVVCFRWANSEGWPVVFVSDNVRQWGYTPERLQEGDPPFARMIHPDDLGRIVAEIKQNMAARLDSFEQEYRIVTADDRVIWVVDRTKVRRDGDGRILHFDGVLTDISQRKAQQLAVAEHLARQQQLNKRLEEAHNQLLQSEKMASIGQLAAGVAHELNNPIGFVRSNLGTLEGYLRDLMAIIDACDKLSGSTGQGCPQARQIDLVKQERDFDYVRDDIFKLVDESKEGIARVSRIVQDLKSFSRVGEQEWKEADLHQGLDSTLNIVWNELKYKCQVVKEYGDIPPVFCLISQLNQVFMNLLVNAGQAIEKQGTITLRTRRDGTDDVCIEVEDTGKGIAPEHLNRIFEPFFTTKPVGKGTGLGLSLSYSIVERHHGRIEVDSTPGRGTTFRVILPIHPHLSPAELKMEADGP